LSIQPVKYVIQIVNIIKEHSNFKYYEREQWTYTEIQKIVYDSFHGIIRGIFSKRGG
jgi:hypothetical protein